MRSQSGPMSQSGGGSGGTVASLAILDAGGDHTITFDTATDEAANRTLTIPALGGNKTIALVDLAQTFTAQQVFETGAAGASPVVFRQTGGVAGTDECQIGNNGTITLIESKSGGMQLKDPNITFLSTDGAGNMTIGGVTTFTYRVGCSGTYGVWLHSTAACAVLKHGGATVANLNAYDGTTGAVLEFYQIADVPTPASNCANIGAEDVAGTAEMIVSDEAGTETQISEHRSDGPNWLYDDVAATGMLDRIEYERQRYLGTHRYKNVSRRDRKQSGLNETTKRVLLAIVNQLGIVLPAEDMAVLQEPSLEQTCEHTETLAEYGIRYPEKSVIQKRDWDTDQAAKQARYDADRQAELDHVAEMQAAHAKALSDYAKLPAAEKAKKPAPVAPELPTVRPAKDIKKPKPSWIK